MCIAGADTDTHEEQKLEITAKIIEQNINFRLEYYDLNKVFLYFF